MYEAMFSLQMALASDRLPRDVKQMLDQVAATIPGRDAPLTGETPKEDSTNV
jgi:hypothetical protein